MTKHDFWRLLNHIEPFDEQSPQASDRMSSQHQGWFPSASSVESVEVPVSCSNRGDVYTNESHKIYDGDISKLMGCLA